ncbi:MAG: hypothetical protein R3F11_16825 [Verrucomicrobiales bacterium]
MNDPDTRESAPPREPAAPEPEYPPGDYRLFAIDFFKTWPAVTWIAALLCTMGAALAALGFAALDWLPQPVSPVAAIIECLLLVACGALLCASGVRLFLFTVAVRRQHQGRRSRQLPLRGRSIRRF